MSVRKGTGSIGAQETHQPEAKQSPSRQNSPRGKYRGSPEQGGTAGAPHHVCRCVPRGYATAHGEVGVGMGEYQTVPNRTEPQRAEKQTSVVSSAMRTRDALARSFVHRST